MNLEEIINSWKLLHQLDQLMTKVLLLQSLTSAADFTTYKHVLLEAVDTANISCKEELMLKHKDCRQDQNALSTADAFCSMAGIVKAVYLPHDRHHTKGMSQHFCMLIIQLTGML